MSAFAEFLAYKQRVPVRGAIMLNENMDQVVLVKGWKKGANWSFPRGKINKDENDLDCAIREVYEETGFDIQGAGLVKNEKEMKYIEVTMREQHMRLYVFRGVPMNTHFEPRTRKEISKIEWYKLTDLPTLKKHKHQDSNGQPQAVNANKFYMVAPFLHPLKKWISQQHKNENVQSLPYLAPPAFSEEVSQDEAERPQLEQVSSYGPSNLPEVAYTTQQEPDASADLKRLLNINIAPPLQPTPQPIAPPQSDAAKSSALLALLRSGSIAEMRDAPHTTRDQVSFPPQLPRSPHRPHPQPPPFSSMPSPPRFEVSPESVNPAAFQSHRFPVSTEFRGNQQYPQFAGQSYLQPSDEASNGHPTQEIPRANLQRLAPYQNTGDPQFSRSRVESSNTSGVPHASALPKLTNHTRTLLDAFKLGPAPPISASLHQISPTTPKIAKVPSAQTQTLLDIFNTKPRAVSELRDTVPASAIAAQPLASVNQTRTTVHRLKLDQRQNLIDLFRQPSSNPKPTNETQPTSTESQLAELAADVVASGIGIRPSPSAPQMLQKKTKHMTKRHDQPAGPREGETAATISGPLNQPQFDGIVRSNRKATNGDRRSPVAANKTLYDHRNPTPVKILARPEGDARRSPARSPRLSKAVPSSSSPRRGVIPRDTKETPKPFQPQILRRPQTPSTATVQSRKEDPSDLMVSTAASGPADDVQPTQKRLSQADSHRQALLSLFNKPLQTTMTSPFSREPVSAISNNVPASQPISPMDTQLDVMETISTQSRVGSLASTGGPIRPSIEKRHTAAGDKAFLLGYLGRIASQEGQ